MRIMLVMDVVVAVKATVPSLTRRVPDERNTTRRRESRREGHEEGRTKCTTCIVVHFV